MKFNNIINFFVNITISKVDTLVDVWTSYLCLRLLKKIDLQVNQGKDLPKYLLFHPFFSGHPTSRSSNDPSDSFLCLQVINS